MVASKIFDMRSRRVNWERNQERVVEARLGWGEGRVGERARASLVRDP
jgi:hypothetical protein